MTRGGRLGSRMGVLASAAAAIGAIFHVIPAVCPFFAPSEGAIADGAYFLGEI